MSPHCWGELKGVQGVVERALVFAQPVFGPRQGREGGGISRSRSRASAAVVGLGNVLLDHVEPGLHDLWFRVVRVQVHDVRVGGEGGRIVAAAQARSGPRPERPRCSGVGVGVGVAMRGVEPAWPCFEQNDGSRDQQQERPETTEEPTPPPARPIVPVEIHGQDYTLNGMQKRFCAQSQPSDNRNETCCAYAETAIQAFVPVCKEVRK